tara:strand:- start:192 stop:461 length:270 start_codon:yes stop_codon:yes gene_type:complete
MRRRIKGSRHVAVHLTLHPLLLQEIDDNLAFKSSRSAWIAGACQVKIDEDHKHISEYTSSQLINILRNRSDYSGPAEVLLKSLLEILTK